jgi:hypothetical protein
MIGLAGFGFLVVTALLAAPAIALGQGSGQVSVHLVAAGPGGKPAEFILWRTGEGGAGKWTIVYRPNRGERGVRSRK